MSDSNLPKSSDWPGSAEFEKQLNQRYADLIAGTVQSEDIAFRHVHERIPAQLILERVCRHYGVTIEQLRTHRKSDRLKPITAWLLTKLGGLTQREVASLLGVTTGAAICVQLKRLKETPWP
jgi:hypothetical protein